MQLHQIVIRGDARDLLDRHRNQLAQMPHHEMRRRRAAQSLTHALDGLRRSPSGVAADFLEGFEEEDRGALEWLAARVAHRPADG